MFRSMNSQEHFSKRSSQSISTGHEVVKESQASSWISMLAAASRPVWTLLHKYLPGRGDTVSSEGGKSKMDFGRSLMAGLDNPMASGNSSTHLSVAYVHCQHKNAESITETQSLTWLTPEYLSELSIQNLSTPTQHAPQMGNGYLKTMRSFLSQVFLNVASTQKEVKEPSLEVWYPDVSARGPNWWQHGYLGSDEQHFPAVLCQTRTSTDAETDSLHCELDGQAAVVVDAKPIELSVHSKGLQSMGCECTRPSGSKDNGSLYTGRLQSPLALPLTHTHGVEGKETGTSAASVFSEVASLTPDQDHGYSSLEEEGANTKRSDMNGCGTLLEMNSSDVSQAGGHGHGGEGDKPVGTTQCEGVSKIEEKQLKEEKVQEENNSELSHVNEASPIQFTPHCHNKAIAYIMGSPCSDESDWEDSDRDSDDDDGFDSEVSSNFSDSDYLEDEDDDDDSDDSESCELDSESQRLLNSLCQTEDPYNPRNFTAPIRTSQKPSAAAAATHLSPLGSPDESESFLISAESTSFSPLGTQENEESSEEACSSIDEAESVTLWNLFSSSSDPYSPLNFRASIRTREPTRECFKKHAGPQLYRNEEAEERMDSGFSEEASVQGLRSAACAKLKKVTFVEEVEEFYASSDEERRGPWEEFARDRCRFQRRIQEVEDSISYCLSPTFRLLTFQRLYALVSD